MVSLRHRKLVMQKNFWDGLYDSMKFWSKNTYLTNLARFWDWFNPIYVKSKNHPLEMILILAKTWFKLSKSIIWARVSESKIKFPEKILSVHILSICLSVCVYLSHPVLSRPVPKKSLKPKISLNKVVRCISRVTKVHSESHWCYFVTCNQ